MKKTLNTIALVLILTIGFIFMVNRYFSAARSTGDAKILDTIQSVRHGSTKEEVRKLLNRDPVIFPADSLPEWFIKVAPEKEKGEYWMLFMGYPPRNLIIYFDENGKAVFTTWASTW